MITSETKYSVNITNHKRNIRLSLHYNAANVFLFGNDVEIYQFKGKDSEITPHLLLLEHISQNFIVDNEKKN